MGNWTQGQVSAVLQQGRVTLGPIQSSVKFDPIAEASAPPRARVVQAATKDHKKLNKLERSFWEVLTRRHPKVWVHGFTLKLGDDCRYTPDFVCLAEDQSLICYETKGFMRDDALVKLKVAARSFDVLRFVLVTRQKGQWIEKEIEG